MKNIMPNFMPGIMIRTTIRNRAGIITEFKEEPGHSWTRWAWNLMVAVMMDIPSTGRVNGQEEGPGLLTARNTAASWRGATTTACLRSSNTLVGRGFHNNTSTNAYGIVAGSLGGDFHAHKFQVDGLIASGTGAGQLAYQAMGLPVTTYNPTTRKWTSRYSRVLNNNSGGDVTVRSVGMVCKYGVFAGDNDYLFTYDKLETERVVEDGGQLTIEIDLISPEITIDVGMPVPGVQSHGGTILGILSGSVMIMSPKDGGYSPTTLNYRSPAGTVDAASSWNGRSNTAALMADANSAIGQWCKGVNEGSPLLSGYNDWYIPSRDEFEFLCSRDIRDLLSVSPDETLANLSHWTSTWVSSVNANVASYTAGTDTFGFASSSQTGAQRVRLIRAVPLDQFVPE